MVLEQLAPAAASAWRSLTRCGGVVQWEVAWVLLGSCAICPAGQNFSYRFFLGFFAPSSSFILVFIGY